jgi:ribosome-associated toxin RatA of RatAB toxin-antitoxin module
MVKIEFSISLVASPKQLIKVVEDYENYPFYLPDQIKNVKVIQKDNDETITEDTFVFKTIVKKEIKQKSKHKILDNKVIIEILSGPAKDSIVNAVFEKINSGTKVSVNANLKLGLKGKIFSPIIKKLYPTILTGIFYKMNTKALEIEAE